MTEQEERAHRQEMAGMHAAQLAEVFDNVIILATYTENGQTIMTQAIKGDWYAARGMAQFFIEDDQNGALSTDIANKIQISEEDDD